PRGGGEPRPGAMPRAALGAETSAKSAAGCAAARQATGLPSVGHYPLVELASVTARRALITGIAGQDGSLLAELLLENGYEVFGVVRRATSEQFDNLESVRDRVELVQADLLDELSLVDALKTTKPHEVYNLASPSFVPMSWRQPVLTAEFAAVGVTALLESIRLVDPEVRFYQASSSEIFG